MCGICGIYRYEENSLPITPESLIKMRDSMVHRGPDGAGTYLSNDNVIGLGHRRLSIIDLSDDAKQPMSNEDNTIWISFNGEVYNYKSLREELISKGHIFKSNSDTEVIIHQYEEKGIDCINDFEGMFAFALWDSNNKKLYLVRDRIGIKPLYYTKNSGRILFSSEIKAIFTDNSVNKILDERSLYHYLSFLCVPSPNTMFEGIIKIPNGHFIEIDDNGSLRTIKYWDPLDNIKESSESEEIIAKKIFGELERSVNLRKVSDVPVGVFLSGGIDSSTNAYLFSKSEKSPIKTFSIGYDCEYKTYQNEFKYAKMMAEMISSDHYEKRLNVSDLLSFIDQMIYLQDEPNGDPVCVPVYYVSKLAKDNGINVCHVGEGSDELFWGYEYWKLSLYTEYFGRKIPKIFKKSVLYLLSLVNLDNGMRSEMIRRSANGWPMFWGGAEVFSQSEKQKLISESLKGKLGNIDSYEVIEPYKTEYDSKKECNNGFLNWMTYIDLSFRLPELLLMRVDKMSMGVSLEARVPFLDHKLVQYALSIPEEVKTRDGNLKNILKLAVKDILPSEIINRRKQGFGVPIYEWFFEELGEEAKEEIILFCNKSQLLDSNYIIKNWNKLVGIRLWTLYILSIWWNNNFLTLINSKS